MSIAQKNQNRFGRGEPRAYSYRRLMQVTFTHAYFNTSNFQCADLAVYPTPTTQKLVRDLGLIYRYEETGFSILYNTRLCSELIEYLRRTEKTKDPAGLRVLSFALCVKDPQFVTFSSIPIGMNPLKMNFYFTNERAHVLNGKTLLNQGAFVKARRRDNPIPNVLKVIPSQYVAPVTEPTEAVVVRDIFGYTVACKPRCVPRNLARRQNPASISCKDAFEFGLKHPLQRCKVCKECKSATDPKTFCCYCRDELFFDFTAFPQGKYKIIDRPSELEAEEDNKRDALYTRSSPAPLCFINLLFSPPTRTPIDRDKESEPGIYPLPDLWNKQVKPTELVNPVHYLLRFKNRRTIWNYLIVPKRSSPEYFDLRIESMGEPTATFDPAYSIPLRNGQDAFCITSSDTLPLQERSTYHLQLKGRLGKLGDDRVIINHLPVASVDQVELKGKKPPKVYSDIYVYI